MFIRIIFSLVLVVFTLVLACGRQTGGTTDLTEQQIMRSKNKYLGPHVPGEILVKFKEAVSWAEVD